VLVPIEHLSPAGVSREFAATLAARGGWSDARVALLDAAFGLYWSRSTGLARRVRSWPPPRLRHIAVLREPLSIHLYAQLLNTSAWTLYESDLDPAGSHAEFAAYLLAHGDRMALTGEVTTAALLNAAWWTERSGAECARFAAAAASSTRPDAGAFQALAAAVPWLRRIQHAGTRGAANAQRSRTGAAPWVPAPHRAAARQLVDDWTTAAHAAVAAYAARWSGIDAKAVAALADWLARSAPSVLISRRGAVLWDPAASADLGRLRAALTPAGGAAVRDLQADLAVLDWHSRRFLASLTDPDALPAPSRDSEQRGYTFMHHQRRMLVYDLEEPGIDRRCGPALPYARAMLGARAVHEWAHLAVVAGWVPLTVAAVQRDKRSAALRAQLDEVIAAAPASVRRATAGDLEVLSSSEGMAPAAALVAVLMRRLPDFQSNLLAVRYLDEDERETYVRQNVRTLRGEYPPARLWRLLIRYLFEFQYLRFAAVRDRRAFFVRSTWFDADFFATGVLDEVHFDALAAAVAALCDCHAVDESKFLFSQQRTTEGHRE